MRTPRLLTITEYAALGETEPGYTELQASRLLRASEVLIIIEIVSPSSKRMDTVVKHDEYADSGIPHY